MKKITLLLVLITMGLTAQAKKYDLSLKLETGKDYRHVTHAEMKIKQSIMGQSLDIKMDIKGSMIFTVEEETNAGYGLRAWYEDMQMTMSISMGEMDLSEAMGNLDDMIRGMLDSMSGIPFNVQLSRKGKVLEVSGMDKLWDSAMDQFGDLPEEQLKQIKEQVSNSYGDKALVGNIEMVTAIFPDHPVKPGESWQIETSLESSFKAQVMSTYQLVEVAKDHILIRGKSDIKTMDQDEWIKNNGMEMKYHLAGNMESDISIDPSSGWIIESTIIQDMEGNAKLKETPQFPDGMDIPMKIHSETSISK